MMYIHVIYRAGEAHIFEPMTHIQTEAHEHHLSGMDVIKVPDELALRHKRLAGLLSAAEDEIMATGVWVG